MSISPEQLEIFGRLALAVLLGIAIGIERNFAHKTAGMRTFALISLGAAIFTTISGLVFGDVPDTRIAAGIVTGMGFLAGGIIIFNRHELQGLTTGAGMWVTAAVGMAAGFGYYAVAIFSTILTVFILAGLWAIEERVFAKGK